MTFPFSVALPEGTADVAALVLAVVLVAGLLLLARD